MVTNNDLRAEFSKRLAKAIQHAGLPARGAPARMSTITGKSPTATGKWLRGEAMPTHQNLLALCRWLGVREEWLAYGKGGMTSGIVEVGDVLRGNPSVGDAIRDDRNVNSVNRPNRQYHYPVISWVLAGEWSEAVTPYEPGAEQHFESTDYNARGQAFWLEVEGDSMTAPTGISVPQGMMILIDPAEEALNGSLVVAQLEDTGDTTFKKLVIDGGKQYLKPLNPAYPVVTCNGGCRIVGVAVEMKMSLRNRIH